MVSTPNPDIALALAEETLAARLRVQSGQRKRLAELDADVAEAQRAVDALRAAPKKPLREPAKRTNKKGRTS